MSSKSNNNGRALEFAYLLNLHSEISKFRAVRIIENSSFSACKKAWGKLDKNEQNIYQISSLAGVKILFELEPLLIENDNDELEIYVQQDSKGEIGDVRDILLVRDSITWEIGLSIKHNHFAVKHSRISPKIDFGEKWYGVKCSDEYWQKISKVFEKINEYKIQKKKWSDLSAKEDEIYVPLLNALKDELVKQNAKFPTQIPQNLVKYLLGKFDFYKMISIDSDKITRLQSYNINGSLNKNGKFIKKSISIPLLNLPTRIIALDFKLDSKNTLELFLDAGWQFSFRLHSASTMVENSLKFDIKIIGMPTTIVTINSCWMP
ncbi:HaeIII family restriction endonuclease [Campylobacter geochelonis]|uniref:HaeIII family restriction endonuclease n=1 Tax=Campylobacter geochelonis TaxID=1780362 RepID=UPI0007706D79|nr:HaeIII family restriction endonuclease [Campylobacter geochelonis]CZE48666.1 HaeIII restriction endonuclease [Campylobacter geochelonis]CZE51260.1 HaeIII restriction endonuclease [Campylobacter geochelonis]